MAKSVFKVGRAPLDVTITGSFSPDSVEPSIRKSLDGDVFGPPPVGRFNWLAPTLLEHELLIARLAIALFEDDNAAAIARVADDKRGGIGTAAVRERLVWMSAECQREAYMREARALLRRVEELR